jgi:hypothetical protein
MVGPQLCPAFEGNVPLMGSAWQGGGGALQHQPFVEHLLCCKRDDAEMQAPSVSSGEDRV